jgi:hypothetical protein
MASTRCASESSAAQLRASAIVQWTLTPPLAAPEQQLPLESHPAARTAAPAAQPPTPPKNGS